MKYFGLLWFLGFNGITPRGVLSEIFWYWLVIQIDFSLIFIASAYLFFELFQVSFALKSLLVLPRSF